MTRFAALLRPFTLVVVLVFVALGAFARSAQAVNIPPDTSVLMAPVTVSLATAPFADFGNNPHDDGRPTQPGRVTWDYTPNATGVLIARATVTGRLYLDSFGGGTVRLVISYQSAQPGAAPLLERFLPLSAGFSFLGADDPTHQRPINDFFSSSLLHRVVLTLQELRSGGFQTLAVRTINARTSQIYSPLRIDNTPTVFGLGGTSGDYQVRFDRLNGDMAGRVFGTLRWNNATAGSPRVRVEFRDFNNVLLQSRISPNFIAPGGDPTLAANRLSVDLQSTLNLVRGRLFRIRVLVGTAAGATGVNNPREQNFDFNGGFNTGTFDLQPVDVTMAAHEQFDSALTWTVPQPQNWHDLHSLKFRIRDGSTTALSVYFDEASQTFALWDEATNTFGKPSPAGANKRLETPYATLFLRDCSVQASGPTSPSVTLTLSLSCKPAGIGRYFTVEVAGSNDEGEQDQFEPAGSVWVTP